MSVRLVFNNKAFPAIRKSPEVKAEVHRRAESIRDACGAGYVVEDSEGPERARSRVLTESFQAMASNAKHNTLLSNLGAGRG